MLNYAEHIATKSAIYAGALAAGNFDYAIISAGCLIYRFNDDLDYPFRPSSYFNEWVPLQDRPGGYLLIQPGERPRLLLPEAGGFWDSLPEAIPAPVLDVVDVIGYQDADDCRLHLAGKGRGVWIGPSDPISEQLDGLVKNPEAVLNVVDFNRAYKSDYERSCLRSASQRAAVGHQAAKAAFYSGASELDIHLAYLGASRTADEELPYRNIIALNENAATLHHMARAKAAPETIRSFLIDAGASCAGYAADVSRTYVAENEAMSVFAQLVADLDRGQQQLVAAVDTVATFPELHQRAHTLITQLLVDHNIVQCGVDEALASGASRVFFPHGLGHLLGIQVHDRGGFLAAADGSVAAPPKEHPHLRLTRSIEPGMVFTVEPGLYFIPALLAGFDQQSLLNKSLIDQLTPFGGIRIEDNVAVTTTGVENLTRDAFSAFEA
ncbi:peptidase M24 [Luminiphilus syltensis NOR5-1B]|uniref:Xaa-Pro dipeptidase n=1 Tax=Luminiphilus syltensis NOR5-1B TaxID=565045 RepID=B8KTW4_9GAMM|nr:Xaa-Pro dipeptidase [Luminiphilus syltensis]EED35958.1 peptidase M24 [Luminiphilus syltensis NOR5-1B]